jgi:hypothetical protein
MTVKPFLRSLLWNTVVVLIVAASVPQWWTSPRREVSAVAIIDRDDAHHKEVQPIREPAAWATAGQLVRAGCIASAVLLGLAFLAIRRDGPHRLLSWLALLASLTTTAAAIAFTVLRPELGPLRPGFALFATFIGAPLGLFTSWIMTRAPWSRHQA